MKINSRAFVIGSILLQILSLPVFAAGPTSAEFRGYIKTNEIVRERLLTPGSDFELGRYLGQSYDAFGTNLLDLLGTHKSGFAGGRFRNGAPNSLNMLIWHMLFSKLALDVASVCEAEAALEFNPAFRAAAEPFCGFPNGAASWDDRLFTLWLSVVSFDAPLSEYEEWRKFWTGPAVVGLSGPEALEWMMLSMMNNPYFLLRL